ncbi:MAG: dihydropteroate synthase [Betaproteobacteria bacterium]|nr:dihydropteroate synthase [Betaproteobacteria bacterium]
MITSKLSSYPRIMGIINVTPDSFSDGGRFNHLDKALAHAHQLIAEGATILDIGGESTRPGAQAITVEEELRRVLPVVKALQGCGVSISVDTRHADVMQEVLQYEVAMINDVTALQDPKAVHYCQEAGAEVCIMHMQGEPQSMQNKPHYSDVVKEVYAFLEKRVAELVSQGINKDQIYIDPGFGFGKTVEHNIQLMQALPYFKELGCPMLIGVSRKNFLGKITHTEVNDRLVPSVVGALWAALAGADIVRVHDVKETKQALTLWQAMTHGVTH